MDHLRASNLGYAEASKIDAIVNKLVEEYPVELSENKPFWLSFTRTLATSMEVIRETLPKG